MAQLQPKIMIVDGFDQYRSDTGAICAQCIRIDLIAHQCAVIFGNSKLFNACIYPLRKRLFCMGYAGNSILFAKNLHAIPFAVGYHTDPHIRCKDFLDPGFHRRCRRVGSIWNDGIIKIQHQQRDALIQQPLQLQIRQLTRNAPGQQG